MIGMVIRLVISAIVLLIIGFLIPGFNIAGFTGALLAAVAIAVVGYGVEQIMGDKVSPKNRGIVGFATSAVVIYISQFVLAAISVTWWGALIAAFLIGVADIVVPTELR